jgi:ATP-dependent DNA helicase RecG
VEIKYEKQKLSTKAEPEVVEKVGENLTTNQQKIIDSIKADNPITARTLALKIGISQRKVEENLAKLKNLGIPKRIGSAKGGHWKIIDK